MSEKTPTIEQDPSGPDNPEEFSRLEIDKDSDKELAQSSAEAPKDQAEIRKDIEREHLDHDKPENKTQVDTSVEAISISRADKQHAYKLTMSQIQSNMAPVTRQFSRLIHSKVVEKTSEVLESSVARPSGILGGGLFATIGLGAMLFFANRNGFKLSGSELLIFIVSGWIVGILAELFWKKLMRR
jgi:hypothetical protein